MTPTRIRPDRELEEALLAQHQLVGGMDEVGRGALAGPVSVGLVVVSRATAATFPADLADSKRLTPRRREALVTPCREWAADYAVGHATPTEIDALGIVGALWLAGRRALARVSTRGHLPGAIILDGSVNWLHPTAAPGLAEALVGDGAAASVPVPVVHTRVKADAHCAVVAAASVLAKVERDALMAGLPDPGYGWARNKGYASPAHIEGLARLGASDIHRRSWHLPGLERFPTEVAGSDAAPVGADASDVPLQVPARAAAVADAPAGPAAGGEARWA